ncbi:pyridoxamine 5'-phosphate oxidase family protein [Paenibacillus marinisediminis]
MSDYNAALNEALFTQLQTETFVLLHTIDAESGGPTTSAISWVYAKGSNTIRFALDMRSRLVANLKAEPKTSMTVFGLNTVTAIYGRCELVVEPLSEVPLKLACFDIHIDHVRDAMFYGARLTGHPEFEKTYDKRAADKLDGQVYAALKKA